MRTEERHDFNLQVAQAIAPTWERRRGDIEQVAAPVRRWMLAELAPRPGQTILELAAGVGDTGFEAAPLVGDGGRVICTDFSPAMVEAARRRGDALGLRNVDYRVMDAERIELEAASVDGVICRYALMLMTDPAAALAETRRVLRPHGRLVLAVWGPPERNPFFTLAGGALVRRGLVPPPDPAAPGIFSLGARERLADLLTRAGFADARIEEVAVRLFARDVDDYLGFTADTAGPLALALRALDEEQRRSVAADVAEAAAPFSVAGGLELPAVTLVAVAR